MSRGRFISKRIGKSDKVADLRSMHARFLYVICYTHADVEGRCTANPQDIYDDFLGYKMRRKYSPTRIEEYLLDMSQDGVGLIILYEAKRKRYMEFVDFHDHQIGLRKDREAPSFIPAPSKNLRSQAPLRSNSGVFPDLSISKRKAKEKEKTKKEEESPSGDSRRRAGKEKIPKVSPEEMLLASEIENTQIKWNAFAEKHNLAKIQEIKDTRKKHLIVRIRKQKFRIEEILDIIEKCPFLLGKTKAGFRVFFDWIILPSNYQKIIEGNYIDQKFSSYKSWLLKKRAEEKSDK